MSDVALRVFHLVPLLLFIAWVYIAMHMVFARIVRRPDSPVLWFFSVVTGPLTRPVRRFLPAGTPERRVLAVSLALYLGAYAVFWAVRALMLSSAGAGPG